MTVTYKVVDNPLSPSTPAPSEQTLNAQGQQGWALNTIYSDPTREQTRSVFTQSGGTPTYKVVDQQWSPSNPTVPETMLNTQGQAGWSLLAVHPDPRRERTRWIFGQGMGTGSGGGTSIPEAPLDGAQYARASAAWAVVNDPTKVLKAGDTMTGNLTFTANGVIVSDQGAAGNYFLLSSTNNPVFVRSPATLYTGINDTGGNVVLNSNSASYSTAVKSTQASTSPTTGALTVTGGLGVSGAANIGGDAKFLSTTGSTSKTTGALTVAGGLGVASDVYANALNIDNGVAPPLTFYLNSIKQSYINDNGGSLNVYSNAAGTAGMYIAHGASAWTALSDARLPWKKNARPLNALDKLEHVQLYENEVDGRLELFGKAQELFQSFPHVVTKGDDDPDDITQAWGVAYDRLGLVALQAVKELLAELQQLKARIEDLEASGVKTPS